MNTPAYFYNIDEFERQVKKVKSLIGNIPLTYSIKANSFVVSKLPNDINYVEVCSPGELQICKKNQIDGSKIIYSGVNKENDDILDAVCYGVNYITIESVKHAQLTQNIANAKNIKQKVLLRLSSGNQFGMSELDIANILQSGYSNLEICGLHYYSGTQKKLHQIKNDLEFLEKTLENLRNEYMFEPKIIEYGPGIEVDYFKDFSVIGKVNELILAINDFSKKYPIGIEMGRFLVATCGTYVTKVVDIKENNNISYVIADGGIHQLRYYGQVLSMQIPPITVINSENENEKDYCICGSLCTVADVLVRKVRLKTLKEGSLLLFKMCGAYSSTEGSNLFLSRKLPFVYLTNDEENLKCIRESVDTFDLNS